MATTAPEEAAEHTLAVITDDDLDRARALIGADVAVRDRQYITEATEDSIRNFAQSTGDDNPLYADPDYAATTRWGGQVAPGIMAAVMNRPMLGDPLPPELRAMKKGLFRGIHVFVSGSEWQWYRPIRPGDKIYSFEGEDGIEVKPSEFAGRTVNKFLRTVKLNQNGEVVATYRKRSILTERKAAKEKSKYGAIESAQWTDDAIAEIDAIFEQEGPRGAEPRYFEDVAIGDAMGTMAKGPLTVTDIIVFHAGGYGFVPYGLLSHRLGWRNRQRIPAFYMKNAMGVPDTAQRVHWDTELSQQTTGNPLPYDYGVMRETWLYHFLSDWTGDDGFIVRMYDEVRKFNYMGDVQIFTGKVVDKREEQGRWLVDVEIESKSQRDVVCTICRATIALPSRANGPVILPDVPAELQLRATQMLQRHGDLVKAKQAK